MDITLHVGGREFFQLSGKDSLGVEIPLDAATITEVSLDPQIAKVVSNPLDPTEIAIDGMAVGRTKVTVDLVNEDGTPAQQVLLVVTVLADDVVEMGVSQVGAEVPAEGDAFPPPAPIPTAKATPGNTVKQ